MREIYDDKLVFVNVTADWCLTCKFNEFTVLNREEIVALFKRDDILAVKADYTNSDKRIKMLLESVNRYAIPTYIIYSKKYPQGLVLRDLLTVDFVEKFLIDEVSKTNNK